MTGTVLVTGATGTVGRHVVAALADRDVRVRAGLRDPASVPDFLADDARVEAFDFDRPETWGPALSGVDGLFLLRPPGVAAGDVAEFVEAAARVGVARVAYLSALGAERNPLIPHHWIEKRVAATDVDHTMLRASFFAQNLLEVHRADLLERGEVFVPAGDGATSFVDARDVGEAAAVVLTDAGHGGRAYDLTGPEALTYGEVAAVLGDVLGERITYPDPSLPAYAARMLRRGHPPGFVALTCGIYTVARLGLAARVADDLRRLLGREPRDLWAFAEDYAGAFRAHPADAGRPP
jgi:uncharacterized protein YbjT (DUF2867 family)